MKTVKWIQKDGSYIRVVNGEETYGDYSLNGLGKIVHDKDISDWAVKSYMIHADLLKQGKRWPDSRNSVSDAPNRWTYYFHWMWIGESWWHRPQKDMTRDAYYALGSCMFMFFKYKTDMAPEMAEDILNAFKAARPPWYIINRLSYTLWRKRLLNDVRKHYVKRINYFKDQAKVWCYEVKDEDNFFLDKS